MALVYDRADWHLEEATTREAAARHLGWYLWWCVERGFTTSGEHPREALRSDATRYVLMMCDGALRMQDLSHKGRVFTDDHYQKYLEKLVALAELQGSHDPFALVDPEATRALLFDWLDAQLDAWEIPKSAVDPRALEVTKEYDLGDATVVLATNGTHEVGVWVQANTTLVLQRLFAVRVRVSRTPGKERDVLGLRELLDGARPIAAGADATLTGEVAGPVASTWLELRLEWLLPGEEQRRVALLSTKVED